MKKIYEYEGKKYELIRGYDLCRGCVFFTEDGCGVENIDEINCFATDNSIFKELKPEEGKP
jgi:hypothetical protein